MTATDLYLDSYTGPSDQEVVLALRRMASARAQLLAAERAAAARPVEARARNVEIEEAHTDLLWTIAQSLATSRRARSGRNRQIEAAEAREREVLRRYGYDSFLDYLTDRTVDTEDDVHLALARREFDDASTAWSRLQDDIESALPTVVIDLTGDDPRTIT